MTFMLILTAVNVLFALLNLTLGAHKEAALCGFGATFCALGAALMSTG